MKRFWQIGLATLILAGMCGNSLLVKQNTVAKTRDCNDVQFIFARGSGETLHDKSEKAWREAIEGMLMRSKIKYGFYELGEESQTGFQYPAAAVSGSLEGIQNLVGAAISAGESFKFGESVIQGANELERYLTQENSTCPETKYVLGGYSQGAMVISRTLPKLVESLGAEKIIYAATFGDPKLYLPEGEGVIPPACYGENLSNYRAYVPDCHTYEGILGSYRPYQPSELLNKLGAWCNTEDIMCSSKWSIASHTKYAQQGLYQQAAEKIAIKVYDAFPTEYGEVPRQTVGVHDVAILIDTTDSMSSMLYRYTEEALKLAERVWNDGGRVALYEYRDLSDPFEPRELCNFECDRDEFKTKLTSLAMGGGGDAPESVLSASLMLMNNLQWKLGATKSVIVLTDEGFINPDRDGTTLAQIVKRSLEIDPVNFYVITDDKVKKRGDYDELTAMTNGRVFDISTELIESTKVILERPIATLNAESYFGVTGANFNFDASKSSGSKELQFDWDLDGDGDFELKDAGPIMSHSYMAPYTGFIQVRVSDQNNRQSTMSAKLTVVDSEASDQRGLATIDNLNSVKVSEQSVDLSWQSTADYVLIIVNEAILGYLSMEDFPGGRYTLRLNDLVGSAEVRLVPYSHDHKGIPAVTTVKPVLPGVPQTGMHNTLFGGLATGKLANTLR